MAREIKKRAVVIGGANMDICGAPAGELRLRDSNPGTVELRPGGVGRNIAHDLRLFGMEVSLVTALGGDVNGEALSAGCAGLGIDLSMTRILPDRRSSTYLYITDETGDMLCAVNDMDITEQITPEFLAPRMERLNGFDAVVLDANLPAETVAFLAENCTAPLYADPVSAAKAERLRPALGKLRALKPNMLEARTLTGEETPEAAARRLLDEGVQNVFISLGGDGLLAANPNRMMRLACEKVSAVNCNGAGDAAMAAIVCAGTLGLSLEECAIAAARAGALTVMSPETNAPELAQVFR